MVATRQLGEAIDEGGVSSTYFFNGRQLSAEDLSREQDTTAEELARLGQALGDGVAAGLQVYESPGSSAAVRLLTVEPGLAINRAGQALKLGAPVNLRLSPPDSGASASPATASFAACELPVSSVDFAGEDLYLLTIAPSATKEGFAPVSGLGGGASCNTRLIVRGVCFRLARLGRDTLNLVNDPLLRNKLAYLCFGVADIQSLYTDMFGPAVGGYGLLDDLWASQKLADCEVPLAVVHLAATASSPMTVDFVDMWSVRRRITAPSAGTIAWPSSDRASSPGEARRWAMLATDRRKAEGEAMFMQFQEQIMGLRFSPNLDLATVTATDYFSYLPPVGVVPVGPDGFNAADFFGDRASNDVSLLDGVQLQGLLREASDADPIDLAQPGKIQLYRVYENVKALEGGGSMEEMLVFASPALPYRGVARFGYAHWDLSRFAPTVN